MSRILLVEDDRTLRETLQEALQIQGYEVHTAADGDTGADLAFSRHFDLFILDWMLPGRSGIEILKEIRREKLNTPVLMLTVRNDEHDKVAGFEVGADDYVTKPFSLKELSMRIKALIRRANPHQQEEAGPDYFLIGETEIDLAGFVISRGEDDWAISPKEAQMLKLLYKEKGKAVSRNRFLDEIWGEDASVTTRTIDTHMLNLRQKIESDYKKPHFLLTVHGIGYRLVLDSSEAN